MKAGLIAVGLLTSVTACGRSTPAPAAAVVRVGWQTPWATQGQIVQALKHTNALAVNGVQGRFQGFTYGGPLNEAALAGTVDVIFTADQPAATLLGRSDKWVIVARLMFNRVAVYVPPESPVRSLTDLRGKTIAMPFGAAAQREALRALVASGLDPARDVRSLNLDIYEQAAVIRSGSKRSWGAIDAMAGFDPTPALLEHEGLARMLHVGQVTSVVVMTKALANSDAGVRFLRAFVQAYYFYAKHQEQADRWFQQESRLTFDRAVLATAASVEPNVRAVRPDQIDVTLTEEHIVRIQYAAEFLVSQKLASTLVSVRDHVDQRPLGLAMTELRRDPSVFAAIRVPDER